MGSFQEIDKYSVVSVCSQTISESAMRVGAMREGAMREETWGNRYEGGDMREEL